MRRNIAVIIARHSLVVGIAIGCIIGAALTGLVMGRSRAVLAKPAYAQATAPESEPAIIAAIQKVGPAVVNIDTIIQSRAAELPAPLREFFGEPFPRQGQASGVIIDAQGHVLTNNHVVQNARAVRVTLADGRTFDASVVGTDPLTDMAVVKIEGADLPVAELGSSVDVPIGGWVIAIGNPFGYENTVTVGVLSARNRQLRAPTGANLHELLQTDASINPGNSGGALVDIRGKVIGIPTAIIPYAQGIGFAISSEAARGVADELIAKGRVSHPWLGISNVPVSEHIARQLKLPDTKGVAVIGVVPDSPAARAGIQPRDVIVRMGEREIAKQDDVGEVLRESAVGQVLALTVRRAGQEVELAVTVGERPVRQP
ncbi:MAG: trypsin-like peptidase domain-containing protein [Armatimonadota bacterium]|nr:MAG: trypsin-like peptidase domain-containing protein [Armatimonadota bacterium]